MNYAICVQLFQSRKNGTHQLLDLVHAQSFLALHQMFQQISAVQSFHQHIVTAVRLVHSLHFQQVLVLQISKDLQLVYKTIQLLRMAFDGFLREGFSCETHAVREP